MKKEVAKMLEIEYGKGECKWCGYDLEDCGCDPEDEICGSCSKFKTRQEMWESILGK
ncbi:MAG: hypothetical protein HQ541_10060 [Mariniphaga sp.]|nr:hypothetical protein [Mariniphaga sp.]